MESSSQQGEIALVTVFTDLKRHRLLLIFLLVGIALVCGIALRSQRSIPIGTLTRQSRQYHEQMVTVCGTVARCTRMVSQRGHRYYTFQLTDGRDAVTVFAFGAPTVRDGCLVTVRGRYTRIKELGPWTFTREIDATYGRIIPGHSTADRWCGRLAGWLPSR